MKDLFDDPGPRMRWLEDELRRHEGLYYREARPEISDREYDGLLDELLALETAHPELASPDSPTRRVGSDLAHELPEVAHTLPVLSLDKCYSLGELKAWLAKTAAGLARPSFVLEEKLDGASLVLSYEAGRLTRALTRGNGLVGNDVTENARTIRSIPLVLNQALDLTVRGEVFIRKSSFEAYNQASGGGYANPRNLAAGSLRNVRSSATARVPLEFLAYEGFFADGEDQSHLSVLTRLGELGLPLNPRTGFISSDPGERERAAGLSKTWPISEFAGLEELVERATRERASLDYEIDGLVLKLDNLAARETLGLTARHPRWAIALKFESPEAETRLNSITVQIGRNGRITPVAELEPVTLSGSLISRATLHNQDYVDQLELAPGDRVAISRRGDVIPAVERLVEKAATPWEGGLVWSLPEACPACQTRLEKRGAHHFCPNRDCPERLLGRLVHFCGKAGLDIEGLGEKTLKLAFGAGLIKEPQDVLSADWTRLLDFEGFGEKKIANIIEGLARAKTRPFSQVLAALGFESLGPSLAETLIRAGFNRLELLTARAREGDWEAFERVHGLAEITARQLVAEFSDERNLRMLAELEKAGLRLEEEVSESGLEQVFAGQRWCVTGSFKAFNPRELAMLEVKKRGGVVTSTVSSKTTHLLAGPGAGSKLAAAQKFGARILNEEEFFALIGKDGAE